MSAICDAHKKKVGIELLYNSVHRKFNQLEISGRENQHPERLGPQAPGWAAQENRKETLLWPIEWGSICCRSVRSQTPSHTQPYQIKWEVYFAKELCRSSLLCCHYDSACIWVCNITCGLLVLLNCIIWMTKTKKKQLTTKYGYDGPQEREIPHWSMQSLPKVVLVNNFFLLFS